MLVTLQPTAATLGLFSLERVSENAMMMEVGMENHPNAEVSVLHSEF